jgi:hypothetical protein
MSDCNKEICDLYDLSVVTVYGVVLEKRFGTGLSNVNRRFCGLEISGWILLSREWQIAASRSD